MTDSVPYVDLNDGNRIPQLGFGVFLVPPDETVEAVQHALRTGYRAIDTAAAYRNEAGVADAVARSGLDRTDVFVTTKVWNNDHGRDSTLRAFERSLGRLRSDYVDLYLIHWPVPSRGLYVETWQALTETKAELDPAARRDQRADPGREHEQHHQNLRANGAPGLAPARKFSPRTGADEDRRSLDPSMWPPRRALSNARYAG